VAETVDNVRKQKGLAETSPTRRLSPAGYQRRHGVKEDVETGETFGARRRKLVEEMTAIGVDGQKFSDIEPAGRLAFLAAVREDLITDRYKPMPNRRVEIPKGNGKVRQLQRPAPRGRGCISTEAVATRRSGASQAQCDAAHVYSD